MLRNNFFSQAPAFKLILLFILSTHTQGWSQNESEPGWDRDAKIKAVFLYNFSRYFEWPKLENDLEFRFGVLSSNVALINALNKLALSKKVGGAKIKVIVLTDVSKIPFTEVLYVDSREYPDFVLNKKTKNTLVVSEYGRDLYNTMISFVKEESKLKFALNKIAVENSGLKMNPDFEVLASAVIRTKRELKEESKKGFKPNETEVVTWNQVLTKLKSTSDDDTKGITLSKDELKQILGSYATQTTQISNRDSSIKLKTAEIESQNQNLKIQAAQLANQLTEIENQKKNIQLQEERIDQQLHAITQQEEKLKTIHGNLNQTVHENTVQRQALEIRKQELMLQQRKIIDQKGVLDMQKKNIGRQSEKLFSQMEQINTQKTILWMSFGFVLVIVFFLILVFRNYKKIQSVNSILEKQKSEITSQKHLIEEKHKEITDSINYAERIQRALLASRKSLDENLGEYFILFKPKDVVSGDFYWASSLSNGNFVLVTADSTGHGVPGAIMSILNMASLKEAVIQGIQRPDLILNETRKLVIESLANDGSAEGGKDGMDASAVSFDFKNKILYCASAFNPVWIVRGSELIEIEADRMPVGKHQMDQTPFSLKSLELMKGDVVYSLTDGYPDQFGGPKLKKYMYKKLKDLLLATAHLSMDLQKEALEDEFEKWKGELEQVDDVTLIGVKV